MKKPVLKPSKAKIEPPVRDPDDVRVISELNNEIERKDDEIIDWQEKLNALQQNCTSLKTQMIAKEAQIQELKRYLEIAEKHAQDNAGVVEQLATLKAALKPFIACAKGEETTVPADWEALKELPA